MTQYFTTDFNFLGALLQQNGARNSLLVLKVKQIVLKILITLNKWFFFFYILRWNTFLLKIFYAGFKKNKINVGFEPGD